MTELLDRAHCGLDPAGSRPCVLPVLLRPAVTGDRAALDEMHARCSVASRSSRWRAPLPAMPRRYLSDAVAGRDGHLAVVADCARHGVVALASAVRSPSGDWELGVLVEDGHQRRGVGSGMVVALLLDIRGRGGRRVIAQVGHDRRPLLSRLSAFGRLRVRLDRDGITGVLDLTIDDDGGRGGPDGTRPA